MGASTDDDDEYYNKIELTDEELKSAAPNDTEDAQEFLQKLLELGNAPDPSLPSPFEQPQGPTTEQLEDLVSKMETILQKNNIPTNDEDDDDDPDNTNDAPFLDADTYINFRDSLNPDGSLTPPPFQDIVMDPSRGGSMNNNNPQAPQTPDEYYKNSGPEPTWEDVLNAKPHPPDALDEDLHQQIMAQEEYFQAQQQNNDNSQQQEQESYARALSKMRRDEARAKQVEILKQLDQEMQSVNESLYTDYVVPSTITPTTTTTKGNTNNTTQTQQLCVKCNVPLSAREIISSPKKNMCQLCFGEYLAESSDDSFMDDTTPSYYNRNNQYRNGQRTVRTPRTTPYRAVKPSSTHKAATTPSSSWTNKAATTTTNIPNPDAMTNNKSTTNTKSTTHNNKDGAQQQQQLMMKRQIMALQQQVQKFKQEKERMQNEIQELQNDKDILQQRLLAATRSNNEQNNNDSPWMEVTDPDTGEVFYWNEETEEMKWDLDNDDDQESQQ